MLLDIYYRLETSEHDGYCSDSECDYFSKNLWTTITFNVEKYAYFGNTGEDFADNEELKYLLKTNQAFKNHIHEIVNKQYEYMFFGSGYCSLSDKCIKENLKCHDYRITIKNVQISSENE